MNPINFKIKPYIILILSITSITGCQNTLKTGEKIKSTTSETISEQSEKVEEPEQQIKEVENFIVFKNKRSEYNSKIDTAYLFKAWAIDLKDPSASFKISSKDFFAVDFDGIGQRSYVLKDRNLKISDENYTDDGDIVKLTNDSLHIKWKATEITMKYIVWKNND